MQNLDLEELKLLKKFSERLVMNFDEIKEFNGNEELSKILLNRLLEKGFVSKIEGMGQVFAITNKGLEEAKNSMK
jgi:DNA-binding PadR family transcriptional regulator